VQRIVQGDRGFENRYVDCLDDVAGAIL
jgi:hypothetical protein